MAPAHLCAGAVPGQSRGFDDVSPPTASMYQGDAHASPGSCHGASSRTTAITGLLRLQCSSLRGRFPPIVLKNPKIWRLYFAARIRCSCQIEAECPVEHLGASDIANADLRPTPSTNFRRGLLWTNFSPIFAKTGVFQHNPPTTTRREYPVANRCMRLRLQILKRLSHCNRKTFLARE